MGLEPARDVGRSQYLISERLTQGKVRPDSAPTSSSPVSLSGRLLLDHLLLHPAWPPLAVISRRGQPVTFGQIVFREQELGEVDATYAAVCVDLDSDALDVICAVRTSSEVSQVKLNLQRNGKEES